MKMQNFYGLKEKIFYNPAEDLGISSANSSDIKDYVQLRTKEQDLETSKFLAEMM